jgi:hypothetical protein
MDSQAPHPIERFLSAAAAGCADASPVATAVSDALLAMDEALAPVIGRRGVLALYGRSIHLSAAAHPWLETAQPLGASVLDVAGLRSVLEQQAPPDAAAGGAAVLRNFHDLLASLVGPSLTERMLRPVWAPFLGTSPPLDTSP